MNDLSNLIKTTVMDLLKRNATSTPENIVELLRIQMDKEKSNNNLIAVQQLELMLNNLEYGKKKGLPICQDTGLINIIVEFSPNFQFPINFKETIYNAIKEATQSIPLRPNSVDPFSNINDENNLGHNSPPIYYELNNEIECLKLTVLNKGGGAENMSQLFMCNPSINMEQIKQKIISLIKNAGSKPCPPIIVGIGIGGDATYCMYLAKKSLLRPLFSRNQRKEVSDLEIELLKEINKLDIGVMGFGGITTCLDVRIEYALRHPASFPVGVVLQCYAHRLCSALIDAKGNVKVIQD